MHAREDRDLPTPLHSLNGNSADLRGAGAWEAASGGHPLVAEIRRLEGELAAALVKIKNLEIALHSSREIGAAIGVVMVQHRTTADRAFDLLREHSQRTHRKLRDIAADVLLTGSLESSASD
jgi:hypothetical protein